MMGVGKSTIGRLIAKRLKVKFIDVDKVIEKKEKISIKKIFEYKGEKYFRKIEEKTTFKILKNKNAVIALGGGGGGFQSGPGPVKTPPASAGFGKPLGGAGG